MKNFILDASDNKLHKETPYEMEAIKTNSLSKKYGEVLSSDKISIHIKKGEIYGLLGLNGAGKTTLIRMLLGMIKPDSGDFLLLGKPMNSNFNQWNIIGYLVETPFAYPNLTVFENLTVYYKLRQLKDLNVIENIISRLKLTKYKNQKAKELSLGNQQRLGLAKALLHNPKLLILDEPINGLDPEGIVEVRELLMELASKGTTILISSHILGEISKIAHRIGIIHQGKLIKEVTVDQLNDELIKKIELNTTDNARAIKELSRLNYAARLNNNEIEIQNIDAINYPEKIVQFLVEKKIIPKKVYLFKEDLEMYFLRTIKLNTDETTVSSH